MRSSPTCSMRGPPASGCRLLPGQSAGGAIEARGRLDPRRLHAARGKVVSHASGDVAVQVATEAEIASPPSVQEGTMVTSTASTPLAIEALILDRSRALGLSRADL